MEKITYDLNVAQATVNIHKMIQSKRDERNELVEDWKKGNADTKEILSRIIRRIDDTISNLQSKLY
jgi:hypothetical protein